MEFVRRCHRRLYLAKEGAQFVDRQLQLNKSFQFALKQKKRARVNNPRAQASNAVRVKLALRRSLCAGRKRRRLAATTARMQRELNKNNNKKTVIKIFFVFLLFNYLFFKSII